MIMKTLKPQSYIDEYYPSSDISSKTIINWIKKGKLNGQQTPTGRWLVIINEQNQDKSKADKLVEMMKIAGL